MNRTSATLAGCGWLVCGLVCQAAAAPVDGMGTPACRQALDTVKAREAQVLQARAAAASSGARATPAAAAWAPAQARLEVAREVAARSCLGGPATGEAVPLRSGAARSPVVVPPVAQPQPLPVRPPTPLPAPAAALPSGGALPLTVVACDPSACWASDGTRLERAGPLLVGPRGACSLQGAQLRCP